MHWWNALMDEGVRHQVWWPGFEPQLPLDQKEPAPVIALWRPHMHLGTQRHCHPNSQKM